MSVLSQAEQNLIESNITFSPSTNWWIGLNDSNGDSSQEWESGFSVGYTNWDSGQPNASGPTATVVRRNTHPQAGTWTDDSLTETLGFICETRVDGDGDGYLAGADCDDNDSSIFPLAGDSFGDGVDTDCDGLDCEAGLTLTGTYFAACDSGGVSYSQANSLCLSGGYDGLASLHSLAESNEIQSFAQVLSASEMWLGLDDQNGAPYQWIDNTAFSYTNWFSGQPNNASEQCANIDLGSGQWHDNNCGASMAFACVKRERNCTDNVDNDGDGSVDAADFDCTVIDSDNDGYSILLGDCDEADGSIYPGATDLSCDGIDSDCNPNPNETDDDGDGLAECNGDCNDTDPNVTSLSLVPVLSSNTSAQGSHSIVVSASSNLGGPYQVWKAFNGANNDYEDCWHSTPRGCNCSSHPEWLRVDFGAGNAVVLSEAILTSRNHFQHRFPPITYQIQGSSNGSSWQTLASASNDYSIAGQNQSISHSVSSADPYRYLRLNIDVVDGGNQSALGQLEFFGCDAAPNGVSSSTAAPSCAHIRNSYPSSPDGVYWLAPNGSAAFQASCDMSNSGGGWTALTNNVLATLGNENGAREYLYSTSSGWIKTPSTNYIWDWGVWQDLSGIWYYGSAGGGTYNTFNCNHTNAEYGDYGLGCVQTGGPGGWKIYPAGNSSSYNATNGTALICQDNPGSLGSGCVGGTQIWIRNL